MRNFLKDFHNSITYNSVYSSFISLFIGYDDTMNVFITKYKSC